MVSLVSIGDVRAVVLVVLVPIFIYVLIIVTLVTNKVIICISLPGKEKKIKNQREINLLLLLNTKVWTAWYLISQHFSSRTSLETRDIMMTTVLKVQTQLQTSTATSVIRSRCQDISRAGFRP